MEQTTAKKYWVIGIILVVVATGVWMFMRSQSVTPTEQAPSVSSITVSDQDANAVAINIDSVALAVPGFIAIHADNNGAPGAYVGSSNVLSAGTHANETIIMTTTPGSYYWAMLHGDDGNGIFEAEKDLPIKNSTGEIIMSRFQVKPAGTGATKG